jgi:heparan-alpha-glucosaminide N-acetyltransferase
VSFAIDIPGCGKGYFGEGGEDQYGQFSECDVDGSVSFFIRILLHHLNYAIIVFLGVQAGRVLEIYENKRTHAIIFSAYSFVLLALYFALTQSDYKNGLVPLVPRLITLSFVCLTASFAFLFQAFLYLIIDFCGIWSVRPFGYMGRNSLFVFLLSGYGDYGNGNCLFPIQWIPVHQTHATLTTMHLWGCIFVLFVSLYLYFKNIFITV